MLRMDFVPLRDSREFRLLFASRSITLFGTNAGEVALLVQAKQLTGSAVAVGLLGIAELVPIVVFGLYGGLLADRFDRGRMLLSSTRFSLWSGGLACVAAVGAVCLVLPGFTGYDSRRAVTPGVSPAPEGPAPAAQAR
jgi:MFS family permease